MAVELYSHPLFSDANLVGYWRFEGNSNDSKGSNNGTDTDITYGSSYGKFVQGALFNGTSSKISKTTPAGLPTGNVTATINMWINPRVTQSASVPGMVVFGKEANFQLCGVGLSNTQLYFLGFSNDATVTYSYPTGTYWMYTVTINNKAVNFYVNGVQQGTTQTLGNTPNVVNDALSFGIQRPGNLVYFDGQMDDVSIFSRELSATEILNFYNYSIGGSPIFFGNTAIA